MAIDTKISLRIPDVNRPDRFFSFRLKQEMRNEPAVFNMPAKILAISDIEGNFVALLHLLVKNKVIDKYLKWTFGEGHLVIVGDCFDRGEQVVECLWLLYSLEEKAKKKGGYVHFILGNHEIMNMNGDWRYVHPKYAQNKRSKSLSTALYTGNSEIWQWLQTKNIVEKIGDTIFVHGGIAPDLTQFNFSIPEINNLVRPFYTQFKKTHNNPLLSLVLSSELSPFWYRGYYESAVNEKQLDEILKKYSANTIVTGHTIVDKISSYFNGKLINVDTNHGVGNSEALLIEDLKFYRVDYEGKKEIIK